MEYKRSRSALLGASAVPQPRRRVVVAEELFGLRIEGGILPGGRASAFDFALNSASVHGERLLTQGF
eukprot:1057415-Lingulodinium_polyedra.AAC.1